MFSSLLRRKNDPVYAIVLSGGYKDDADGQKEIIYTGQGGQKNGVQVSTLLPCLRDPNQPRHAAVYLMLPR